MMGMDEMRTTGILRLLRWVSTAVLIMYASTFGWRFLTEPIEVSPENKELRENLERHVRELSHEIGPRSMRYYAGLLAARDSKIRPDNSAGRPKENPLKSPHIGSFAVAAL